MLGISIFSLFVVYAILGIGYALNKMGRHISSYSGKSKEDAPKLTIEDMYSPNNKLSYSSRTEIHILYWYQIIVLIRKNLCLPTIQ